MTSTPQEGTAQEDADPEAGETEPLLRQGSLTDDYDHMDEDSIPDLGGNDVVQFSSPMYFFDENDEVFSIDVIRLGAMKGRVAVEFVTKDGTAKNDVHFEAVRERLVFNDREHTKIVKIRASEVMHTGWRPTMEFKISLECPLNCDVGTYLHTCRVKMFDNETFPSKEIEQHIRNGEEGIKAMPNAELFKEYWKLNFRMARVRWQTILTLLVDQLMNSFLFLTLWVGVYIVDTLFDRSGNHDKLLLPNKYHTAVLIALCFVLPNFALFAWDLAKTHLDIQGASESFMQASMMGIYLDFNVDSRYVVTPPTLSHAITDCASGVANGYVAALNIIRLVGKIGVAAVFLFIYFKDPLTLALAFVMIIGLVWFAIASANHYQRAQDRAEDKYLIMETLVGEASQKFPLVHGYSKRLVMHDMFRRCVARYIKEKLPGNVSAVGASYITRLLSGAFLAVYIIVKTPAVFSGELSLGVFLATISLFSTTLTDTIAELNGEFLKVIQSFSPLKDLTLYMNLPTTLPEFKDITNQRNDHTRLQRQNIFAAVGDNDELSFHTDQIKISVTNVCFEYVKGHPVLKDVNLNISQGQLVAVTGPPKAGKSTFMDLLAHTRYPSAGSILIPSHLRLLHIAHEPMFLRASIFSNLCLGLPARELVDMERIFSILEMCGIPEMIETVKGEVHYSQKENDSHPMQEYEEDLPVTQQSTHHIATDTLDSPKPGMHSAAYYAQISSDAHVSPRDSTRVHFKRMNSGIKFDKKRKSRAKWETFLTHSQKIKIYIACALVSNPNVLIMMRTLDNLQEEVALEMLEVLALHVKNKGLCLPVESINSRRPLNVFYSTERKSLATVADTILQVDGKKHSVKDATKKIKAKAAETKQI